ncbi:peptide deformylase [Indioceanicola profundi]|uniref:peptide deformylase n=1 Tax=Indioceanicola profundi TaxID=2220096 RepID=UPI000E6AC3EC|nr:peptide deformylase [Indioceanicola profundi]
MTILKIARMGHPVLRRPAQPVESPIPAVVRQLAQDMVETMLDAPGIGLAAPQVHIGWRVVAFRVPADRSTGQPGDPVTEPRVLVNPELEPVGDEMVMGWEGCLSIPGLRGLVPRYARLRYRGYGLDGQPVEGEASGTLARVLQHEVDHLDGILYLDRMPDLTKLTFTEEMKYFAADLAGSVPPPPR